MNKAEVIAKAERGEGLTVKEVKIYQESVKPVKHTYGKYGTLAKKYKRIFLVFFREGKWIQRRKQSFCL